MNAANCSSLRVGVLTGTWYRAIQPQHWPTALGTSQTKSTPTRFNSGSGQFESFYLAEDPMVALFEVQALFGSPQGGWFPNPRQTWVTLNVRVQLRHVVDLTVLPVLPEQKKLDTNAQELTGDWEGYHLRGQLSSVRQPSGIPAPSQELGAVLYATPNIEALQTISAKIPTHRILVVFPQKLQMGSSVEFEHPQTGTRHTIP